ncbi:MAG: co-chaperone GroES [Candidatus Kapabacteria bacterium]|nr:co-chaperone GroES [Candidatus Kapabacteria bacterium]
MNLTPLYDRIIVKSSAPEEITKGGIIIPDTAKEKPMQGVVVATGTGKMTEDGKLVPLQVKTGDQVIYGKYSGTEISVEGEDYLMMRESDVFAIVK